MRDPDARHYALECLKLAQFEADQLDGRETVERAKVYLDFVLGTEATPPAQ